VTFLNKKGKDQFGDHFRIDPADYEIIFKLLTFAIKDTANAAKFNINLNKGILLSGPVGCGKTSLMSLLNGFIQQSNRHVMKSCRDISFEFIQEGYEVIHRYSKNSINRKGENSWPRIYCFDDLGIENNLRYYGNECNVMAEILLSRYDLFVQKKMLTHITTNLSASEIESMYGSRVRSRMREMFNLISFSNSVLDKRA
jgi:DNA replication protein DnaC